MIEIVVKLGELIGNFANKECSNKSNDPFRLSEQFDTVFKYAQLVQNLAEKSVNI